MMIRTLLSTCMYVYIYIYTCTHIYNIYIYMTIKLTIIISSLLSLSLSRFPRGPEAREVGPGEEHHEPVAEVEELLDLSGLCSVIVFLLETSGGTPG